MLRQGDILIIPVGGIPPGAKVEPENGRLILARGEATGHHHSIAATPTVALFRPDDAGGVSYLEITGDVPVLLEHQEHDDLTIYPGLYEIRRQREYSPQANYMVKD